MLNRQLSSMEMLFQALADATSLRILWLLLNGEVCVCDIHESLKIRSRPLPGTTRLSVGTSVNHRLYFDA